MKNISLFKLLFAAVAFSVAVLWFLSMFIEPLKEGFNIYWAIAALSGGGGIIFIIRGVLTKKNNVLRRTDIALGAALLVSAVLATIKNFIDGGQYALPLIAVIVTGALLFCVIFINGKAWDVGDNQRPGYKDYRTRKAEEEQKHLDEKARIDERKKLNDNADE